MQFILVGPEPGYGTVNISLAKQAFGGECSLLLSVTPGFETQPAPSKERMRKGRTIAHCENIRVRGSKLSVHCDAIVDFKMSRRRKRDIGNHADACDHTIG